MFKNKLYYYQQPYVNSKPFFKQGENISNVLEQTGAELNKLKRARYGLGSP